LKSLEVLFDQNEINCYHYLQETTIRLRSLTESSEVWIETIGDEHKTHSLKAIMKILENLNFILLKNTEITYELMLKTG